MYTYTFFGSFITKMDGQTETIFRSKNVANLVFGVCAAIIIFFCHLNIRWFMGIGHLIKPHTSSTDLNRNYKKFKNLMTDESRNDRKNRIIPITDKKKHKNVCDEMFFILMINCQCLWIWFFDIGIHFWLVA